MPIAVGPTLISGSRRMSEASPIPIETEATNQGEQKLIRGVHPDLAP